MRFVEKLILPPAFTMKNRGPCCFGSTLDQVILSESLVRQILTGEFGTKNSGLLQLLVRGTNLLGWNEEDLVAQQVAVPWMVKKTL